MLTAVDSNILIDIFLPSPKHLQTSREILLLALSQGSLIACDIVWAEVRANFDSESDFQRAMDAVEGALSLASLEKTVGRVHALWKPVATEEAFEIVRRRLFNSVTDTAQAAAACRAFADTYTQNRQDLPNETVSMESW